MISSRLQFRFYCTDKYICSNNGNITIISLSHENLKGRDVLLNSPCRICFMMRADMLHTNFRMIPLNVHITKWVIHFDLIVKLAIVTWCLHFNLAFVYLLIYHIIIAPAIIILIEGQGIRITLKNLSILSIVKKISNNFAFWRDQTHLAIRIA